MSKVTFEPSSPEALADLKAKYRSTVDAPLDGMWETFTGMANHFSIRADETPIGYCAVNSEQKMLQFFAVGAANASDIFRQALARLNVNGAVVSTAETTFLGHCMDYQTSVSEHAIMYHLADGTISADTKFPEGTTFRSLATGDLKTAVDFAATTLGADAGWLESYFGDLISRGELYALLEGDTFIATGECRPSHTQFGFADVGMIVGKGHRGKGIATNMLRQLIEESTAQGLRPICSTEQSNIPAQKAITKAGFTAYHRILETAF